MSETGARISRIYSNFRGADFRGEEINLQRSPDCLNVWKDYKETESIRTRPAMELKETFGATVRGIFFYNGVLLVHSGTSLYKVANGVRTQIYTGLRDAESQSFVYNGIWYFKDGKNYLRYDGFEIKKVESYIPITSIGRKPSGGGTIHEDVNMLQSKRINTFVSDTVYETVQGINIPKGSVYYYLDTRDIDTNYVPRVWVNGEECFLNTALPDASKIAFEVDYALGRIMFHTAPPPPLTDGQDNVTIEFSKAVPGYGDDILKCTMLQVFDNRVFLSGNPDKPNVVWHCSLDDPTYFSDLDYYKEGLDAADVKGIVAGNNALWVFREPSDANTTVFYHTPTIDSEYGKIYPSQHSSVTTGCVGKAINFNDDIIFFSERGMEGISGDITTEQIVAHRSSFVDRKMISEKNYKNMVLAEWEGYLIVFIGNKAYLADSRTAFAYDDHIEYEWFYWEMEKEITCARVNGGILYLGTSDGVYTLTDLDGDVKSYWVTPKDKFKSPHKLKTTNKRGCVVEATGDITVYAKTEDTDFEPIGSYENVTDYFVSRIKRKKFKDIQLKFYSNTRFSLETATLECFIGGYIKR